MQVSATRKMKLLTEKMIARKEDHVGWMIFNNPARRNALSLEMWTAMGDIMADFQADEEIRVAVMAGAGEKAFVSGADISEFEKHRSTADAEEEYNRISSSAQRILKDFDKPLVAMILLSASDVVYRNVAGVGVPASIQLNEMLMVAMTFGALAATQMRDGHVSVDLATSRLTPRVANLLQAAGLLVSALVTAWATWASWHIAVDALRSAEVSIGIANMPTWPSRFLVTIGLGVLTAEIAASALGLILEPSERHAHELAGDV